MRQILCFSLLLMLSAAHAAPIALNWSGTVTEVFDDIGTTSFTGTSAGAAFSGSFVYDTQPGNIINDPPEQICDSSLCEWEYTGAPYGGIANGRSVSGSNVLIENDQDLVENPGDLDLINTILEPDIELDTPFDIWELSSQQELAPNDQIEIVLTWITTDTSTFADATAFTPIAPFDATPAAGRGIAFFIFEVTDTGLYQSYGIVESVDSTAIPLPAAVWLFGSALGMLGWATRRSRRGY